jgi:predicted Zn-dependent protease
MHAFQRHSAPIGLVLVSLSAVISLSFSAPNAGAAGSEDGPNPNTTVPSGAATTTPKYPATTTKSPAPSTPAGAAIAVVDPVKDPAAGYEAGKSALGAEDWKTAIEMFTGVTTAQPTNADAWNLLGYATRKNGNPTAAIPLYAKALLLNPKHRGALEYQGEAYVQTNQMTKAKANLAALKKICGTKCEEYKDLAKFISSKGKSTK